MEHTRGSSCKKNSRKILYGKDIKINKYKLNEDSFLNFKYFKNKTFSVMTTFSDFFLLKR